MAVRCFRHVPTLRWLPILQSASEVTPGSAYIPALALEYQLVEADIEVVEQETIPDDLEINFVPIPPKPPSASQELEAFKFPSLAAIDTAIDNVASLADAKVVLRKMAKAIYFLAKMVNH